MKTSAFVVKACAIMYLTCAIVLTTFAIVMMAVDPIVRPFTSSDMVRSSAYGMRLNEAKVTLSCADAICNTADGMCDSV